MSRRQIASALCLGFVAALSAAAVAAQGLPADVVDAVPGGETSVVGMLLLAIGYLGKQLLARPSPDAHREAVADLRAARERIDELTGQLTDLRVRLAAIEAVRASAPPT